MRFFRFRKDSSGMLQTYRIYRVFLIKVVPIQKVRIPYLQRFWIKLWKNPQIGPSFFTEDRKSTFNRRLNRHFTQSIFFRTIAYLLSSVTLFLLFFPDRSLYSFLLASVHTLRWLLPFSFYPLLTFQLCSDRFPFAQQHLLILSFLEGKMFRPLLFYQVVEYSFF